jgi:hypothetical protein
LKNDDSVREWTDCGNELSSPCKQLTADKRLLKADGGPCFETSVLSLNGVIIFLHRNLGG